MKGIAISNLFYFIIFFIVYIITVIFLYPMFKNYLPNVLINATNQFIQTDTSQLNFPFSVLDFIMYVLIPILLLVFLIMTSIPRY